MECFRSQWRTLSMIQDLKRIWQAKVSDKMWMMKYSNMWPRMASYIGMFRIFLWLIMRIRPIIWWRWPTWEDPLKRFFASIVAFVWTPFRQTFVVIELLMLMDLPGVRNPIKQWDRVISVGVLILYWMESIVNEKYLIRVKESHNSVIVWKKNATVKLLQYLNPKYSPKYSPRFIWIT